LARSGTARNARMAMRTSIGREVTAIRARITCRTASLVACQGRAPAPVPSTFVLPLMRRDVRILLVGDGTHSYLILAFVGCSCPCITEGVGKSTIVTSLIKESYVPHVSSLSFLVPSNLSRSTTGATHCPRGDHPARSYSRKRDNIYRRFRR
jgi:hypothetical protein